MKRKRNNAARKVRHCMLCPVGMGGTIYAARLFP